MLFLSATVGDFARLSDGLEAISIRGLAALNAHQLDACRNEAHLVDYLRLTELDRQLLREHSRRQPE